MRLFNLPGTENPVLYTALTLLAGLTLLTGLALLLISWRWFVQPVQDSPARADAIVVFAGGYGERFRTAVHLADKGIAPLVIVNIGALPWAGQADILQQCERHDLPYQLLCTRVEEDNTAGEARLFARMAQDRQLASLVVVTSEYHLKRASTLLSQCYTGRVMRVGSDDEAAGLSTVSRDMAKTLVHEWGGLLYAWTIERYRNGCR